MIEDQAAKVLKAGRGQITAYVKVVKASNGRYGAAHAATASGALECGTKPHEKAKITEVGRELKAATCRSCRTQLGLDGTSHENQCLAALFVLSITLGLRPGELRKLTWEFVDLNRGVIHVWRSASKPGDTKTPKSKRSLVLPKRAVTALKAHKAMQDRERIAAGSSWQGTNLAVVEHAGGSLVGVSWEFALPCLEPGRTLSVRGDPGSREREGTAAKRPSLPGFKSEERPVPGRLRVTTTLQFHGPERSSPCSITGGTMP
jgi:hypothetical protein